MDYLGKTYQFREEEVEGLIKLLENRGMITKKVSDSRYDFLYHDGRPAMILERKDNGFVTVVKENSTVGKAVKEDIDLGKLVLEYGQSLGEM